MFRVKDPLDNLRLKVSLRKINVTKRTDTPAAAGGGGGATGEDYEELTVKWQEKYFSLLEKVIYRRDDTSSHYRSLLEERERNSNRRLFTYINSDRYHSAVSRLREGNINGGKNIQVMHLMADLQRQEDSGTDYDEVLLCTITFDSDGLMWLSCQLSNDDDHWYRIENSLRDVYEYRILNVSQQITEEELSKERLLHAKLYSHQTDKLQSLIGDHFETPPLERTSRIVHILGSIETGEGFDDVPIYLTLQLFLPNDNWQITKGCDIISTQLSSCNKHKIAHFSCPYEYTLLCTNNDQSIPYFSIEVYSLDLWDRHRLEGCASYYLPQEPGSHVLNMDTYKPYCVSLADELRRYFIGGSSSVHHLTERKGNGFQSKFGVKTVSSGKVKLKVNIVHHSHDAADRHASLTDSYRQHGIGLSLSVRAVTDAYYKARTKALQLLAAQD